MRLMALALVGVSLSGGALRWSIALGFAKTEPGAPLRLAVIVGHARGAARVIAQQRHLELLSWVS